MSCPQPENTEACEYDRRKHRCRNPNPWIQHLVMHGKQGKTLAEIRALYVSGRTKAQNCTVVRRNIRDRQLDMGDMPRDFLLNLPLRTMKTTTILKRIAYEMHNKHKIQQNWVDEHYITTEMIEHIYHAVDRNFSNGSIGRWFSTGGRKIKLYVVNDALNLNAATCYSAPPFPPLSVVPEPGTTTIIIFNSIKWVPHDYPAVQYDETIIDGEIRIESFRFKSILESLIYCLIHELCHALSTVQNHGVQWKTLMRNMIGLAGTNYFYEYDYPIIDLLD